MIYLVSQMILALCVAMILGAALGWLLHRATHNKQTLSLKQGLARYKAQQIQALSDIELLEEDFNELQRQSNDRIASLQQENSQIPALSTNLEKSQLLVKQMMQRHEGALRDLTNENQRLTSKLAKIEAQEQVKNQLAAKLDERRASSSPSTSTQTAPEDRLPADTTLVDGDLTVPDAPKISRFAAAEAADDPFDEVIEVAQELQQELDQPTEPRSAARSRATASTLPTSTDALQSDTTADSSEADDLDAVYELDEFEFDGSHDEARLFEPVSQQDDLQQIFGIGPLTEKALNELGITSYSQLATLEKPEIQRIADALEIGPARIERDNWVGNARRQLEEVLEQL